MVDLTDNEKNDNRFLIPVQCMNVTDGQTDRHHKTACHAMHSVARQKK